MRLLCRLAALLPLLTAPLAAQAPAEPLRLRGITFDHWDGAAGPALFRPTLRATNLSRGRLGSDFALVFFPDGISFRPPVATVGLQAGLAYRLAVGPASLLLKGGGAAIVVAGVGGEQLLHIVPGLHWASGCSFPWMPNPCSVPTSPGISTPRTAARRDSGVSDSGSWFRAGRLARGRGGARRPNWGAARTGGQAPECLLSEAKDRSGAQAPWLRSG